MGLRGRIEESLGTHGLMKVMFSDQIKHNDTVCMSLYNRVYPKAEFWGIPNYLNEDRVVDIIIQNDTIYSILFLLFYYS